jgi:hypothetical protein
MTLANMRELGVRAGGVYPMGYSRKRHRRRWFLRPARPPWAVVGIARRVGLKNYVSDSNGALTVPCLSSPAACTGGHTSAFWACWPTTRLLENRARATLANTGQISTALICGGSAEPGLRSLVDGQSANLHFGSTQVCAGRSPDWIKVKNPDASATTRLIEG